MHIIVNRFKISCKWFNPLKSFLLFARVNIEIQVNLQSLTDLRVEVQSSPKRPFEKILYDPEVNKIVTRI